MTFLTTLFAIAFSIGSPRVAKAYPEFIGYGYSSCLTCHYNGLGGGPLTDYGRALWSTEIASRALYPSSMPDEDIGNQSGFLGSVPLPYWIRPEINYRGLELRQDPGSGSTDKSTYYQMQSDISTVFQDRTGRYAASITLGRELSDSQFGLGKSGLDHMFLREYYARVEALKGWWVYAGLMEKVFGIRNVDHESFQRTYQGFNVQNNTVNGIDESQGVIIHRVAETWEVALNAFAGNPYDDKDYKQAGYSGMGEFGIGENKRLGFSLLSDKSNMQKQQMAAVHYRHQIIKGSALMFEWGLIQDTDPSGNVQTGSYNFLQSNILLVRGYDLLTVIERYNQEFRATSPDQWKWAFGAVAYPVPRLEIRLEATTLRSFSSQGVAPDSWTVEGQVHVSL